MKNKPNEVKRSKVYRADDKYYILFDYGAYEGCKFYDERTFQSADEAVRYAVGLNYATPFYVVQVKWEPE